MESLSKDAKELVQLSRWISLTEMGEAMERYSEETFEPIDSTLEEVLQRAKDNNMPEIQIGRMDCQHLDVFIRMGGYKRVIEVGTLAGFSGIPLARAVGPDGSLDTIEINPKFAEVAKESFRRAGVADKVTIHVGEGLKVLQDLASTGPYDALFLDAEKLNYPSYLRWAEKNIRVGGALIADNTFAWGYITDETFVSENLKKNVLGIKEFNRLVANSPKWRSTILPTRSGLTVSIRID